MVVIVYNADINIYHRLSALVQGGIRTTIIWPPRLNWSSIMHRIWRDLVFSAAYWQTAWSVPAIYRAPLSAASILASSFSAWCCAIWDCVAICSPQDTGV
jgi:hypothetical protein